MAAMRGQAAPGAEVWMPNPYPRTDVTHWDIRLPKSGRPEYVPGVIDAENGDGTVTVRTAWEPVKSVTGKIEEFLPMETSGQDLSDMASLKTLHEQGILDNLQKRFIRNKMYTLAGEVLVCTNPYHEVKDDEGGHIHSYKMMVKYAQARDDAIDSMGIHEEQPGQLGKCTGLQTRRSRRSRLVAVSPLAGSCPALPPSVG